MVVYSLYIDSAVGLSIGAAHHETAGIVVEVSIFFVGACTVYLLLSYPTTFITYASTDEYIHTTLCTNPYRRSISPQARSRLTVVITYN